MVSISLTCPAEEMDRMLGLLWEHGTDGVREQDLPGGEIVVQAFFRDDRDAKLVMKALAPRSLKIENHPETDWVAATQLSFPTMLVGDRLFVAPVWSEETTPPGRVRLVVEPGLAYGTGAHESTRLCLVALDRLVTPSACVLDLGTGSGILARAAALLGARFVVACDIDGEAARIAQRHLNGIASVYHGSVRSLCSDAVDLIVANVNASGVDALSRDIRRVLVENGTLIVSGFKEIREDTVIECLGRVGFVVREKLIENSWCCLVF